MTKWSKQNGDEGKAHSGRYGKLRKKMCLAWIWNDFRRRKCFWKRKYGALLTRRSLCHMYAFCRSQYGSWFCYRAHDLPSTTRDLLDSSKMLNFQKTVVVSTLWFLVNQTKIVEESSWRVQLSFVSHCWKHFDYKNYIGLSQFPILPFTSYPLYYLLQLTTYGMAKISCWVGSIIDI